MKPVNQADAGIFSYRMVAEETLYIDLPYTDGLMIKGILRGSIEQPLIVMLHGLPGEGNSLKQYLGARYLYERGFASLRLFLYANEPQTRNLVNCALPVHAKDLDTVIAYLRKQGAIKIFAEGHSYGGLTILLAESKLDGVVLWDPTHGLVFRDTKVLAEDAKATIRELDDIKLYLHGMGYAEPKTITREQLEMGDTTSWAAHKNYPLKIISAGDGAMTELGERYIEVADQPKQQVIIEKASHSFTDSDEIMVRLFKETADWFEEIMND